MVAIPLHSTHTLLYTPLHKKLDVRGHSLRQRLRAVLCAHRSDTKLLVIDSRCGAVVDSDSFTPRSLQCCYASFSFWHFLKIHFTRRSWLSASLGVHGKSCALCTCASLLAHHFSELQHCSSTNLPRRQSISTALKHHMKPIECTASLRFAKLRSIPNPCCYRSAIDDVAM